MAQSLDLLNHIVQLEKALKVLVLLELVNDLWRETALLALSDPSVGISFLIHKLKLN